MSSADCIGVPLIPVEDAFVRETVPTINYGSAGALAVSGADAVNALSQPQGRYDTVMKFNTGPALAAFDAVLGPGNWSITRSELVVTEVGNPFNLIFNRGLGDFEVFWLSDDTWVEGPGSPLSLPPHVGVGNEMTWDLMQTILGAASQSSLGAFSNQLLDGTRVYDLSLTPAFLTDILAGGDVTMHLTPLTTTLGFTFFGKDFFTATSKPRLVLFAETSRGDVNCDAQRDLLDVDAFLLALLDPAQFVLTYPGCDISNADVNSDGTIDGEDISVLLCAVLP